ncbi:MAG: response regulator [Anaerolineae bacterium]
MEELQRKEGQVTAAAVGAEDRPRTILVIEDSEAVREAISQILGSSGYEVLQALDGAEGLRLALELEPDLVLLDVMMPEMGGYEVARDLRGSFRTATIPVVMLTALGEVEEIVKGMDAGADDYVVKPFDPDELLSRVATHIRRSERDIGTNPLTRLPGNVAVERAVWDRIRAGGPFAVCYLDLDNFKPYNDTYGFFQGDGVLEMLGDVVVEAVLDSGGPGDFVGHEGGDDFVVVTDPDRAGAICEAVIAEFDPRIVDHYNAEDRSRGYIVAPDRDGTLRRFPTMTVAIAVVTNEGRSLHHPRQVAQLAAQLLKEAKPTSGSQIRYLRGRG